LLGPEPEGARPDHLRAFWMEAPIGPAEGAGVQGVSGAVGSGRVLGAAGEARGRPEGSSTRVPVTARGEYGWDLGGRRQGLFSHRNRGGRDPGAELAFPGAGGGDITTWGSRCPSVRTCGTCCILPERRVVGCMQFSSAARRMAVRDAWCGWDDVTLERDLPRVVNNSRFPILPWVRIKNLASRVLSLAVRRLGVDWPGALRGRGSARGDAGGHEPLPRGVLPGGELDSPGGDHGPPDGSGALCVRAHRRRRC